MEAQVRPAAVTATAERGRGWIVSPVFDLLFLANLGWLLLLLPGFATRTDTAIDFWQIYFLTLPHRWLTLVLVLTDPDRRDGRSRTLALIAALAAVIVIGAYLGTGAFLCLAMIDYVWNAWHFASQHAGVLRMYARKVGGGPEWLERWGLRIFVTYTAIPRAGWTTGWIEADTSSLVWLHTADLLILLLPAALVATNLNGATSDRLGKLTYLGSVCLLHVGFLMSMRFGWMGGIVALAAADRCSMRSNTWRLSPITPPRVGWKRFGVSHLGALLARLSRPLHPCTRHRRRVDDATGEWSLRFLAGTKPVGCLRPLCVRRDDLEVAAAADGSRFGSGIVNRSDLRLVLGLVLAVAVPAAIVHFAASDKRLVAGLTAAPFAWPRVLVAHLITALPLGLIVAGWARSLPAMNQIHRGLCVVLGLGWAGVFSALSDGIGDAIAVSEFGPVPLLLLRSLFALLLVFPWCLTVTEPTIGTGQRYRPGLCSDWVPGLLSYRAGCTPRP